MQIETLIQIAVLLKNQIVTRTLKNWFSGSYRVRSRSGNEFPIQSSSAFSSKQMFLLAFNGLQYLNAIHNITFSYFSVKIQCFTQQRMLWESSNRQELAQYAYFDLQVVSTRKAMGTNSVYMLGQVKFPNFLNTALQILQMVDLVRVNAKKIDLKASNQFLFGLLRSIGGKITV